MDLDDAAPHLRRIAQPALSAFTETVQVVSTIEKSIKAVRPRIARPVRSLMDGIDHWGLYATFCTEQFAAVGIARDMTTHPLTYAWNLGEAVRVQIKSDTDQLCVQQLALPGMSQIPRVGAALIALTWNHDASGRFDPTFAHIDNGDERWRVPVAAIAAWDDEDEDGDGAGVRQPIRPDAPKSTMKSRLKPVDQAEDADDTASS